MAKGSKMSGKRKFKAYLVGGLSWVIKAAGLALLALVLVIAIGEGPPNPFGLSSRELFLMVSLLVTLVGTVLAMWRQLIGGILILAGQLPFIDHWGQWVFAAFVIVGILNLLCWWFKKSSKKSDDVLVG